MDKIAQKLSDFFGSTPFIAAHIVWVVGWLALDLDREIMVFTMTVEGIFLVLFVLRAENISERHNERRLKEDLAATKRIEKKLTK